MKQARICRQMMFLATAAVGAVLLAGCNCDQQVQTLESQNQALASRIIELESDLQRTEAAAAVARADAARASSQASSRTGASMTSAPTSQTPSTGSSFSTGGTDSSTGQSSEYNIYTVVEGDNLWNIAKRELGKGIRYKEILALNPSLSENEPLKIGTKLVLPPE